MRFYLKYILRRLLRKIEKKTEPEMSFLFRLFRLNKLLILSFTTYYNENLKKYIINKHTVTIESIT